jgi:hypothetical protein
MSDDAKKAHYVKMQQVAEQIINQAPLHASHLKILTLRYLSLPYLDPSRPLSFSPFAKMGSRSSDRQTPTATYDEMIVLRAKAIELGLPSLATAALIGWEWLQRETDIFAVFDVSHSRPKEHPETICHSHRSGMADSPKAATRNWPIARSWPKAARPPSRRCRAT